MKSLFNILVGCLFLSSCSLLSEKHRSMDCFTDVDAESITSNIKDFKLLDKSVSVKIPEIQFGKDYVVNYKDLFDSIYVVPLQTTSESLVGRASKILFSNDTLYILDVMKTKCVKRFKKSGEYIDDIGNEGNGPGEYVEPTDIFIGKDITIYDQFQQKLIFYAKNGTFLYEKKVPFAFMQFAFLDESTYLFRYVNSQNFHIEQLSDYNLWTSDTSFNIGLRGLHRISGSTIALWSWTGMRHYGDSFFINDGISDTIYKVDNNKLLSSVYVLDFDGHRPSEAYTSSSKLREYSKKSDFYHFPRYDVCDKYLFLSLGVNGRGYDVFYSNDSKSAVCCNLISLSDNGVMFPSILDSESTVIDNTFVSILDCYKLLDNPDFDSLSNYIGGCFDNIKPDDNPVLVFYKMK